MASKFLVHREWARLRSEHSALNKWRLEISNGAPHGTEYCDGGSFILGHCDANNHVVWLSEALVANAPVAVILNTLRHEAAHALDNCMHGHGDAWKACCALTGAKPEQYSSMARELGFDSPAVKAMVREAQSVDRLDAKGIKSAVIRRVDRAGRIEFYAGPAKWSANVADAKRYGMTYAGLYEARDYAAYLQKCHPKHRVEEWRAL